MLVSHVLFIEAANVLGAGGATTAPPAELTSATIHNNEHDLSRSVSPEAASDRTVARAVHRMRSTSPSGASVRWSAPLSTIKYLTTKAVAGVPTANPSVVWVSVGRSTSSGAGIQRVPATPRNDDMVMIRSQSAENTREQQKIDIIILLGTLTSAGESPSTGSGHVWDLTPSLLMPLNCSRVRSRR